MIWFCLSQMLKMFFSGVPLEVKIAVYSNINYFIFWYLSEISLMVLLAFLFLWFTGTEYWWHKKWSKNKSTHIWLGDWRSEWLQRTWSFWRLWSGILSNSLWIAHINPLLLRFMFYLYPLLCVCVEREQFIRWVGISLLGALGCLSNLLFMTQRLMLF